jgi:formylglycine-generating enzyme required for sulfatase activity
MDEAARLAPWVPEYQFRRGMWLAKAERSAEAARAFKLYLAADPGAADRQTVSELIRSLGAAKPPQPGETAPRSSPALPSPPARMQAGTVFKDCADCPEMVVIPAGRFVMGSPESELGRYDSEGPLHAVAVKSFALGKYDVTEQEFLLFLRQTGYQPAPCDRILGLSWHQLGSGLAYPPGADAPKEPAVCLSWYDARSYIAWLNRRIAGAGAGEADGPYRLPSEAEWEYAARAGTRTARWWGEAIGAGNANCNGCGSTWDNRLIAEAGSFPANPFGLHDMLGNVWQWTQDCWNETYAGAPGDGSAWAGGDCRKRVIRGGSWSNLTRFVRSAARSKAAADGADAYYDNYAGFRLARSLP